MFATLNPLHDLLLEVGFFTLWWDTSANTDRALKRFERFLSHSRLVEISMKPGIGATFTVRLVRPGT